MEPSDSPTTPPRLTRAKTPVMPPRLRQPKTPRVDFFDPNPEDTPVDKSDMTSPFTVRGRSSMTFATADKSSIQFTEELKKVSDNDYPQPHYESGQTGQYSPNYEDQSGVVALRPKKKDSINCNDPTSLDEDDDDHDVAYIQPEWVGTSLPYLDRSIGVQTDGKLEVLMYWRNSTSYFITQMPYDPDKFINLSSVDDTLGFSDICGANAYRALLLVDAGLNTRKIPTHPANLGEIVRENIARQCNANSWPQIRHELEDRQRTAYKSLICGLIGCGAFWDGIAEAKAALRLYPNDSELKAVEKSLKESFLNRCRILTELKSGRRGEDEDFKTLSRAGKIYQKKYPSLDDELFFRTPALLRNVNAELEAENIEIRQVIFGPQPEDPRIVHEGQDVGPLGIFATRDIPEGDIIMADRTLSSACTEAPSKFIHCDACQAVLVPPYMVPMDILRPRCCNRVAYCSRECYESAKKGYHKIICGMDFDWLYEHDALENKQSHGTAWRPLLFLRLVAIILADFRNKDYTGSQHPLMHPLVSRMAANYPPNDVLKPDHSHEWLFWESVIAPAKILTQLGIDIFNDTNWTPEIIQTILWRIENNANSGKSALSGKPVNHVALNPNYLFFNHSCLPNVSWYGAIPEEHMSIEWLQGKEGEILRPGCSVVFCVAARDIAKGEELKISYVGNPAGSGEEDIKGTKREDKRSWLDKWFSNGCGCIICEKENAQRDDGLKDVPAEL